MLVTLRLTCLLPHWFLLTLTMKAAKRILHVISFQWAGQVVIHHVAEGLQTVNTHMISLKFAQLNQRHKSPLLYGEIYPMSPSSGYTETINYFWMQFLVPYLE